MKIRGCNARTVGRTDIAESFCLTAGQEVPDPLGRSPETAAGCREGSFFDAALENHAGERMIVAEILRTDAHKQRGIAVFRVTGMETHAVDHNAARLGSRSDHMTAGAHTECIDAASVRRMADQLIGSCAKGRMACKSTVLGMIDENSRMLDPDTHRKGFLRHYYTLGKETLDGIPGGMPDAKDDSIRKKFAAFAGMGQDRAFHMAVTADELLHTGFKQDGAAEGKNFLPDGGDHPPETVGSDMGHAVHQDFLRRAMGCEGFQDGMQVRGFDTAGKLSV